MKLRIKGDSVRLRLSQSDLHQFEKEGRVEEVLHFADGRRLVYALRASEEVDQLAARFDGEAVPVLVPSTWVPSWVDSDSVGFETSEVLKDGSEIYLLVEKDFQCLHKRSTGEEAFPQPTAGTTEAPRRAPAE